MKRSLFAVFLAAFLMLNAQENITGGYYGILQYYMPDSATRFSPPSEKWRSMQYFNVLYMEDKWEAGLQIESYLPRALLGYDPEFRGTRLTSYYLRYRNEEWDITAGHVYDQFGAGLALRTWEDRQLGINNALAGIRLQYRLPNLRLTFIGGNPRTGMQISSAAVTAFDISADLHRWFSRFSSWEAGFSAVSKYEPQDNARVPALVNIFAGRTSLSTGAFDFRLEYAYKTPDALYHNGIIDDLVLFDGDAVLLNVAYGVKGFGTNLSLRRSENMRLYALRSLTDNPYNRGVLNYIPALVKQHDYLLTNLFVYSADDGISFANRTAGEIGGQWDAYFFLKRKSFWGGRYGTRMALNWSRWHALKTRFLPALHTYRRSLWKPGPLRYQDINTEIKKKLSKRVKTSVLLMYQIYNRNLLEGHGGMLHNYIAVSDWQVRLPHRSSLRVEAEHLWNFDEEGHWAAAAMEYAWRGTWNFFLADRFHYGGDKIHYYRIGGAYNRQGTRLALAYARERGGLICVGGVCRYVPPNTGWQLTLNIRF